MRNWVRPNPFRNRLDILFPCKISETSDGKSYIVIPCLANMGEYWEDLLTEGAGAYTQRSIIEIAKNLFYNRLLRTELKF